MHLPKAIDALERFQSPDVSFGTVDAGTAGRLIAAAADVSLVVDRKGVIRDLALGSDDLRLEGYGAWLGQPWGEVVTVETREKVERLLREATPQRGSPWRQINHPSVNGPDIPILYSVMALRKGGPVLAIGRDIRGISILQRKLVDAQAAMEREYARVREVEMRYRLLFQLSGEPVFIVDAGTRRIAEANPAAATLLGLAPKDAVGLPLADVFDRAGAAVIGEALAQAQATGRAETRPLVLAGNGGRAAALVSLFRQDRTAHFLVRLDVGERGASRDGSAGTSQLLAVVETMPDGFVVCDTSQRIILANTAFLDLVQVPTLEQVKGEPLDRWVGRSSIDLNVLVASLREHGSVRHFGTIVRGEYGATDEVEIAAVSVPAAEKPCYGFAVRPVARRVPTPFGTGGRLPDTVAQLTELVGRVSMKELVRETTDLIEKMCIEAALELTGNNRASAAEILGLSRQSFYAKMHRFGLGDLGGKDR